MIISHRKNFLFLHTPKTGGTAIIDRLLPYARWQDRLAYQREHAFLVRALFPKLYKGPAGITRLTGLKLHAGLKDGEGVFGREKLSILFKFGMVRNPYTRTYSLYRFIARNPRHPLHTKVNAESFEEFVTYICKHRWAQQHDRFCWRGDTGLSVDHVAIFENYNEECAFLAKRLNIPALENPRTINVGDHEAVDYNDLFHNVRDIFLKWYAPDFEAFHYSKDPARATEAPKLPD